MKSALVNRQAVKPLADAFFAFEDDGRRGSGKPPNNGRARLRKIKEMTGPAKAEIRAFLSRLQTNGETAAFDKLVYESARKSAPAILSELKAAGGPSAMLRKADAYLDEMIADREKIAGPAPAARVLDLLGFATVEAYGLRSGFCSAIWYVFSAGYGERFAYRSCYY